MSYLTVVIPSIPGYTVGGTISNLSAGVIQAKTIGTNARAVADAAIADAAIADAKAVSADAKAVSADAKAVTAQGEVDALETAVANQVLSQEVIDAAQQSILDGLSGSVVGTINTTLAAHQAQIDGLGTDLTGLGTDISDLATETNTKLTEVATGMTAFQTALDALFV